MNQVTVAPREIVDAVYRASRAAAVDPGLADVIAGNVAAATIAGEGALDEFLADLEGDRLAESRFAGDDVVAPCADARSAALRDGVTLDGALFRRLEAAATAFLMSEALLDEMSGAEDD